MAKRKKKIDPRSKKAALDKLHYQALSELAKRTSELRQIAGIDKPKLSPEELYETMVAAASFALGAVEREKLELLDEPEYRGGEA